jgi:hypothetical protein
LLATAAKLLAAAAGTAASALGTKLLAAASTTAGALSAKLLAAGELLAAALALPAVTLVLLLGRLLHRAAHERGHGPLQRLHVHALHHAHDDVFARRLGV